MTRHGTQIPTIDVELARRLVADQMPQWSHLPVRPVELSGWDNRTFRLGDDMSVRLPSAEGYREQVAKEQHWLPRLAPHLPLPVPTPLALGRPALGYPWPWSVYRWIDGAPAATAPIADHVTFARDVAAFLGALQRIDADGGPGPGTHNFHRGGPVAFYDDQTQESLRRLAGRVDVARSRDVWEAAIASRFDGPPVWLHGDVAPGNLLVRDGRLSAVIDFGTSGVGDPACDLVLAWTFLGGEAREAFRRAVAEWADGAMWARARGWALWKALITFPADDDDGPDAAVTRRVVTDVLAEHAS
ncbi:aminoglycoside phosphotransferase [Beutenbergia cavernae DSM 12333]|uniref:Aminoglycoside phosphotransferase n=1 Tax=Beutenbergia cavernae (strain ATCC BAA-8 / DSM 12333 / CCUG 43141 / JCM 11478 / NBRC 16432 / NCIMB 13614 / HKI 0122) TaxID=471853 RepID=C5C5Y0_BEUC1|nr:aminoglycoside phosphotransferase family protein [Beutenbergia cavernae]ACQ82338.1 aminoglycoside phosphotransferase [Beutenbergia cavernae DSM 12333]